MRTRIFVTELLIIVICGFAVTVIILLSLVSHFLHFLADTSSEFLEWITERLETIISWRRRLGS